MSDTTVNTKIALMEKDVAQFGTYIEKFDTIIEKMTDVSNSLKQIVAVHDQKIGNVEKLVSQFSDRNLENKQTIDDQIRKINESVIETNRQITIITDNQKVFRDIIDEMTTKLSKLDKWRWLTIGFATCLILVVAVVTNKPEISALFKLI